MLLPKSSLGTARKTAMTVEQLARTLGAELVLCQPQHAGGGAGEPDPAARAQAELNDALHRLRQIDHVSSLAAADRSSLVFVEDAETLVAALGGAAGAILAPASLTPETFSHQGQADAALLLVEQPRLAFARAAPLLHPPDLPDRKHPSSFISMTASIGLRVGVGPFAVIEAGAVIGEGSTIGAGAVIGVGVVIGANCRIYPRVVLYPGTRLGDRVVVHAGAVLGADGFGYVRDEATGEYLQFPQKGTLVVEDDVEIGANTTIDRGALEQTRIARGVKIDNLVHVGHNVQVGADTVIAAQVGISGSSTIGAGAMLAGQVGIGDHAAVGDGVILGGQGGVLPHKTLVGKGQLFWGTPAKPVKQCLRELASLTRLALRHGPGDPAETQADQPSVPTESSGPKQ